MAISTLHLNKLPDLDLVERLCSTPDDDLIYAAFAERFHPKLTDECIKISKRRKLDELTARDIAHKTLEKFRKHKSFEMSKMRLKDPRKAILAYLCTIAYNLFNDHYHATNPATKETRDSYFSGIFEGDRTELDPAKLQRLREQALNVFNTLNPGEQKVLLTDLEYKKAHIYLPEEINEKLAQELGVKKASIRKIRERAIKKLKKGIHDVEEQ